MAKKHEEHEPDPFEGHEPLPGLEHLGRHIADANGQPSGSPANFEALRGQGFVHLPTTEDAAAAIALIQQEFAPGPGE